MRVSQPFEFADMNETFYQVARLINLEDNGTPDYPGDDHLTFEVVLFPYAKDGPKPMEVDQFPIEPEVYPPEVQQYLISYEDDISNITPELKETMLAVVNGTGEAYSTPARTDVQAIERIMTRLLQRPARAKNVNNSRCSRPSFGSKAHCSHPGQFEWPG
jgi:hypothetical protein